MLEVEVVVIDGSNDGGRSGVVVGVGDGYGELGVDGVGTGGGLTGMLGRSTSMVKNWPSWRTSSDA